MWTQSVVPNLSSEYSKYIALWQDNKPQGISRNTLWLKHQSNLSCTLQSQEFYSTSEYVIVWFQISYWWKFHICPQPLVKGRIIQLLFSTNSEKRRGIYVKFESGDLISILSWASLRAQYFIQRETCSQNTGFYNHKTYSGTLGGILL